jgi:hypothetical protein
MAISQIIRKTTSGDKSTSCLALQPFHRACLSLRMRWFACFARACHYAHTSCSSPQHVLNEMNCVHQSCWLPFSQISPSGLSDLVYLACFVTLVSCHFVLPIGSCLWLCCHRFRCQNQHHGGSGLSHQSAGYVGRSTADGASQCLYSNVISRLHSHLHSLGR